MRCHGRMMVWPLFAALAVPPSVWAQPVIGSNSGSGEVLPEASRVVLFRQAASTTAIHAIDLAVTRSGEVAWIIAVPQQPTVGQIDYALVDELDRLTAPSASNNAPLRAVDGEGCSGPEPDTGCAGSDAPGRMAEDPVDVVQRVQLQPLEVVVLSSGAGDALDSWLAEHGYAVPTGLATVVQPYADAGWFFVVVRIDPTAAATSQHGVVPLRLDYADPQFGYPSRLLALTPTAVAHIPLTLFVVAAERALTSNQPAQTLQEFAPDGWIYARQYQTMLADKLVSDARIAWVVESAQRFGLTAFNASSPTWSLATALGLASDSRDARIYVTRLTTVATRLGAQAAPDLLLQLDPTAPTVPNMVEVPASAGLSLRSGGWWLPFLLLSSIVWCWRRVALRRAAHDRGTP